MLSINSLSESLLPNLYVKSLDLQTFSATTVAKKNVPKYQGPGFSSPEVGPDTMFNIGASKTNSECNIVLSVKSLKTSTYSEEIIELLNSEFSDNIKIFAHQITDRFLYESILQALASGTDLNNNNSIADLELPTEANFKSIMDVITREDTKNYVDGLKNEYKKKFVENILNDDTGGVLNTNGIKMIQLNPDLKEIAEEIQQQKKDDIGKPEKKVSPFKDIDEKEKAEEKSKANELAKKKMEDFKKANPIPQQGIQILINQGDKNDKNLREDVLDTAEQIYPNVKREDLIRMIMDALRTKKSRPDILQ